jgi:hypothetical protein
LFFFLIHIIPWTSLLITMFLIRYISLLYLSFYFCCSYLFFLFFLTFFSSSLFPLLTCLLIRGDKNRAIWRIKITILQIGLFIVALTVPPSIELSFASIVALATTSYWIEVECGKVKRWIAIYEDTSNNDALRISSSLSLKWFGIMYEEQVLQYLHDAIESTFENIFDDLIVFRNPFNHFQIYVNNEGTVRRYELQVYYSKVNKRIVLTFNCDFLYEDLRHHLEKVFSAVEVSSHVIKKRRRKVAFDETHKDQEEDLQDVFNNLIYASLKNRDTEFYYCMRLVQYNYNADELQQDVLNDLLPAIYRHLLLMFQQKKKTDPEFSLVIVTALKKIKKVVNVVLTKEEKEVLYKFKSVDYSIFGAYYHGRMSKKQAMKYLLTSYPQCFILFTDEEDEEDDDTASLLTLRYFIPAEKGVQKAFFVDEKIVYNKVLQVFMVFKHNKVVNSFKKANFHGYLATKGHPLLANIHFRMISNQIKMIL